MKYEIIKGSEKDFEGAPEWATLRTFTGGSYFFAEFHGEGARVLDIAQDDEFKITILFDTSTIDIIAERRPITDEADLNECIGRFDSEDPFHISSQTPVKMCHESSTDWAMRVIAWSEKCKEVAKKELEQPNNEFIDDFATFGKYDRQCKGVAIDVYDVLQAFEVVNPALQHLIKKALCAGLRGHKKREQDLVEILESAKRAIELEGK